MDYIWRMLMMWKWQMRDEAALPRCWNASDMVTKKKRKKKKEKRKKRKENREKKVWRVAILLPILSNISFCIVEVITTDGWSWGRIKVLIKTIDWIMIWRMILRLTVLQWFTIELNRKFLKNFKILKKKAGWNSSIGYSTVPNSKKLKL